MFRCYWMPALLAEELPENECPPVRVKLFSERLLAFRDTDGKYGLIDEFCAHRGVSLWFGRNEEHGLRCPYHGWKYDTTGQCIDVPSEPMESGFCKKIKLKSYPLVKIGPVLWTYMGPPDKQPPLPEWEFAPVPAEQSFISKRLQESNWLQAMEGGIDSSHVSFLHRGDLGSDPLFKGAKGNQYNLSDMRPHFEVVEQPGGLYIGARRNAENGNYYWRITPWVMPNFTHDPAARRPSDARPLLGADRRSQLLGLDLRLPSDPRADQGRARRDGGRPGPALQIRAGQLSAARQQGQRLPDGPRRAEGRQDLQRHRGLRDPGFVVAGEHGPGLRPHQGEPGLDRQRHHHGAPSACCAREGVGQDKGTIPPGVDPEHHSVRSVSIVLPPDQAFKDGAKEALTRQRVGKAQTTV